MAALASRYRIAGGSETQSAYVIVPDADAHYARAKANGAQILLELNDEDYGGRGYTCRDLEGHIWSFGTYDPWEEPHNSVLASYRQE